MTKTTEKNPRGRPRYCFSYQEAAQIAQSEGITSAKEYAKWWKFNLPSRMPKRPDAAYRSQGFSWLYFLGGNNTFPMARKTIRPFKDAKTFVSRLGLKTRADWFMYSKSGNRPDDIPGRPDITYRETDEWISWKDFLGANLMDKHSLLVTAKRVLFFIVKLNDRPSNVYKFGTTYNEPDYLINLQKEKKLSLIKISYLKENSFDWISFIDSFGKEYEYGEDNEYYISNIGHLLSEIQEYLEPIIIS